MGESTEIGQRVDAIGTLVVVGDTHTSLKYKGSHKNYANSSIRILNRIQEILKQNRDHGKVSLLILGDLFGVQEKNINNEQYLGLISSQYSAFNDLTDGRVFAVRGNHDMGGYTTFDYALQEGWIRNPETIDLKTPEGTPFMRAHIVNYGQEERNFELADGLVNIAFGHNDFYIPGVTTWYGGETTDWHKNRIDIGKYTNFQGMNMLVSGHIHTPTPFMDYDSYAVPMPDGSSLNLVYPGSPSRTTERFDDCYYLKYVPESDGASGINTRFDFDKFGLWPVEEEFEDVETVEEKQNRLDDKHRHDQIAEVLQEFMGNRTLEVFDSRVQIKKIPGYTDEVRDIATRYYEDEINNGTEN